MASATPPLISTSSSIPSRPPPLPLSLFPPRFPIWNGSGRRGHKPRRRRGVMEAATSRHLLPCSSGGTRDQGSNSHNRRGAGEREQQQPHQAAVLAKQWSTVPLPSSSAEGQAKMNGESATPHKRYKRKGRSIRSMQGIPKTGTSLQESV